MSAVSYGAVGVFGKLAYDEGLTVSGLLAARFAIAAVVMWAIVAVAIPGHRPSRRGLTAGVVLGAAVYAAQTGLFFASIRRLDAAFAVLLVYVAPALVAIGAVAFGREALRPALLVAIPVAMAGTALVATGGGVGSVDGIGVILAFGCAISFAAYMLLSHAVVGRVHPIALSASVCTGCAISFGAAAVVRGELPDTTGTGWLLILGLALLSTVVAVTALAAGTSLLGPSAATLLSTLEPVTATVLAFIVLGERLAALQLVGGVLVILSVVLLSGGWDLLTRRILARRGVRAS